MTRLLSKHLYSGVNSDFLQLRTDTTTCIISVEKSAIRLGVQSKSHQVLQMIDFNCIDEFNLTWATEYRGRAGQDTVELESDGTIFGPSVFHKVETTPRTYAEWLEQLGQPFTAPFDWVQPADAPCLTIPRSAFQLPKLGSTRSPSPSLSFDQARAHGVFMDAQGAFAPRYILLLAQFHEAQGAECLPETAIGLLLAFSESGGSVNCTKAHLLIDLLACSATKSPSTDATGSDLITATTAWSCSVVDISDLNIGSIKPAKLHWYHPRLISDRLGAADTTANDTMTLQLTAAQPHAPPPPAIVLQRVVPRSIGTAHTWAMEPEHQFSTLNLLCPEVNELLRLRGERDDGRGGGGDGGGGGGGGKEAPDLALVHLVLISGCTQAGKSSLARGLVASLSEAGYRARHLCQDPVSM